MFQLSKHFDARITWILFYAKEIWQVRRRKGQRWQISSKRLLISDFLFLTKEYVRNFTKLGPHTLQKRKKSKISKIRNIAFYVFLCSKRSLKVQKKLIWGNVKVSGSSDCPRYAASPSHGPLNYTPLLRIRKSAQWWRVAAKTNGNTSSLPLHVTGGRFVCLFI